MDSSLARISKARKLLAEARTVEEKVAVRDMALAAALVAKRHASLEVCNDASELACEAERAIGLLLDELCPNGRPKKSSPSAEFSLRDLGISNQASANARKAARVPEDEYRDYLQSCRKAEKQITLSGLRKLGSRAASNGESKVGEAGESNIVADLSELSGDKFGAIYADPPWKYGNQATRAATDNHYNTMTVEELCALPVGDLADDNSHLHLWTTNGFLREAFDVIDAWGFTYKSCAVWCKPTIGIGNYVRVSHEFILIAVRGNATKFETGSVKSWFEAPRSEHSTKPEHWRMVIEENSPGPYLELFGRCEVEGWTVFGNQVQRMVIPR